MGTSSHLILCSSLILNIIILCLAWKQVQDDSKFHFWSRLNYYVKMSLRENLWFSWQSSQYLSCWTRFSIYCVDSETSSDRRVPLLCSRLILNIIILCLACKQVQDDSKFPFWSILNYYVKMSLLENLRFSWQSNQYLSCWTCFRGASTLYLLCGDMLI